MSLPARPFPAEFFSIDELATLAGSPQRARIIGWLNAARVPHVVGLHGWPLVYRTKLLAREDQQEEAKRPELVFDASGLYGTKRKHRQRPDSDS